MEMEPEKEAELSMPDENEDNGGKAPSEEEEDKAPELELEDEPNEGDGEEEEDPEAAKRKAAAKKKRKLPPLFSSSAHYHWKQCSAKSGHRYVPCVDFDGDGSQKHHERSCPRSPVTCLVSLPKEYRPPAPWPERKDKVSICTSFMFQNKELNITGSDCFLFLVLRLSFW
jgi:tRNA wybutosine-synthesizing protein 1